MPPTCAIGDASTRMDEERFLDLIYSDADLLAAEFDAIIAAQWPETAQPPPPEPRRFGAAGRSSGPHAARRAAGPVRGLRARPRYPGVGGWARQRSPPVPTPDTRQAGRQVIATREPTPRGHCPPRPHVPPLSV